MESRFKKGFSAYQRGGYEEAVREFETALLSRPGNVSVLGILGMARLQVGDLLGARKELRRAEEIQSTPEGAFRLGLVELAAERFEEALGSFARARERGYDPQEVSIAEASCLALIGEGTAARELLDGLLEEGREQPEALYWYAVACAQERERPELRSRSLENLRELVGRTEGVSDWLRGRAHFLLASLLDDADEDFDQAIEHYQEGLAYDPTFVVGRNNLGAVYLSQGRHEEARQELLQALCLQPGYRRVHGNLARLYYSKLEESDLREDLAHLARVLPEEQLPEAMFGLMVALMDETRSRAAQEFYDRGHSLKNLLALTGSRIKRLQRQLPEGEELVRGLETLKAQYDEVYQRLAGDLRLVRPPDQSGERVDVNAILRKVARRMQREAGEGLEVVLELSRVLPVLLGNSGSFHEAVLNLARNSSEAMEGTGTLILASRLVDEERRIEVEVRDDGPGLPVNQEEAVFQSGFTTKQFGSGIGLALVRRTLRDMHGTVRAGNHPQGGAVFTLQVPVEVRYHPTQGLGLAARPVRLDEVDTLNVDELA
jgi:signal transduction histidine kinase